ncbi:hypothetical protein ElyMa_001048000 [Elysia marginata]|uniref:Uncharacterized protein n=1 Tax=Elysia marginata TaxID=1093978 RepID=A0AAV4HQA6_9GAST|nr:hypothetical protein ElyMa_001048000 [Elysia marginata]
MWIFSGANIGAARKVLHLEVQGFRDRTGTNIGHPELQAGVKARGPYRALLNTPRRRSRIQSGIRHHRPARARSSCLGSVELRVKPGQCGASWVWKRLQCCACVGGEAGGDCESG